MTDYEAGYRAFSDDESGRIGRAVAEHMMGGIHMDVTLEWFRGYNDAADDFYKSQDGGE